MTKENSKQPVTELSEKDLDKVAGAGDLKTGSTSGLVAHELTHLTQQTNTQPKKTEK